MHYFVKKYSEYKCQNKNSGFRNSMFGKKKIKRREFIFTHVKKLTLIWKCDLNIMPSKISFCRIIKPLFLKEECKQ